MRSVQPQCIDKHIMEKHMFAGVTQNIENYLDKGPYWELLRVCTKRSKKLLADRYCTIN